MFCDLAGKACDKDQWLATIGTPEALVGHSVFELDGSLLEVYARYSGLSHGQSAGKELVYELGITGDAKAASHRTLHLRHELFADKTKCLTAYNKAVSDVKAAGAQEVPGG